MSSLESDVNILAFCLKHQQITFLSKTDELAHKPQVHMVVIYQ